MFSDGWYVRLLLYTARFIRPAQMKSKGFMIGSWGHAVYEEMLYILYILFERVMSCYCAVGQDKLYINKSELMYSCLS